MTHFGHACIPFYTTAMTTAQRHRSPISLLFLRISGNNRHATPYQIVLSNSHAQIPAIPPRLQIRRHRSHHIRNSASSSFSTSSSARIPGHVGGVLLGPGLRAYARPVNLFLSWPWRNDTLFIHFPGRLSNVLQSLDHR